MCTGGYTRAYVHHLVKQKEMVGSILLSLHNVYYLLELMRRARQAIVEHRYGQFVSEWDQLPAAKDW